MTYGVKWEFGLSGRTTPHTLDFHIMKNAPARVILSEHFLLEETHAFSEYDCYLLDADDEDDHEEGYILAIDLIDGPKNQEHYADEQQFNDDHEGDNELDFRAEQDARIAKLPPDQRDAATAVEGERRRMWDETPGQPGSTTTASAQVAEAQS